MFSVLEKASGSGSATPRAVVIRKAAGSRWDTGIARSLGAKDTPPKARAATMDYALDVLARDPGRSTASKGTTCLRRVWRSGSARASCTAGRCPRRTRVLSWMPAGRRASSGSKSLEPSSGEIASTSRSGEAGRPSSHSDSNSAISTPMTLRCASTVAQARRSSSERPPGHLVFDGHDARLEHVAVEVHVHIALADRGAKPRGEVGTDFPRP